MEQDWSKLIYTLELTYTLIQIKLAQIDGLLRDWQL